MCNQKYKILFLDVDGVLKHTGVNGLDHYTIKLLLSFIEANPDVRIVLSSDWRLDPKGIQTLKDLGIPIYSKTTDLYGMKCRGEEILQWIIHNEDDIFSYVIIDDHDDILPQQFKRFVRTNMRDGLLPVHLEKAKKILCCPMNSPVVF